LSIIVAEFERCKHLQKAEEEKLVRNKNGEVGSGRAIPLKQVCVCVWSDQHQLQ